MALDLAAISTDPHSTAPSSATTLRVHSEPFPEKTTAQIPLRRDSWPVEWILPHAGQVEQNAAR